MDSNNYLWEFIKVWFSHYKIFFYSFLLELPEMLGIIAPIITKWFQNWTSEKHRIYATKVILIIGIPIASYLSFHDAKIESATIQKRFDRYQQDYRLLKTTEEQHKEQIKNDLLRIYQSLTILIQREVKSNEDLLAYKDEVSKFLAECDKFFSTQMGPGGHAKFADNKFKIPDNCLWAFNEEHKNIIHKLRQYKDNTQEILENPEIWESSNVDR